jgi:uncharacterized protein GlcG (DUF336 family)
MAAAEAEAKKNNWPVVISIIDSGGHLVALHRMDNTQLGSVELANGKAITALKLRRPTKALQDGIEKGGVNLRWLGVQSMEGLTILDGGILIVRMADHRRDRRPGVARSDGVARPPAAK